MSDDVVKLTEVGSEAEAATIVGFLEAQGIHATYDKGGTSSAIAAYDGPGGGRQQILVRAEELDAASAALASIEAPEPQWAGS